MQYRLVIDIEEGDSETLKVSSVEEGISKAKEEYLGYLKVNDYSEEECGVFDWNGDGVYTIGGRDYCIIREQ